MQPPSRRSTSLPMLRRGFTVGLALLAASSLPQQAGAFNFFGGGGRSTATVASGSVAKLKADLLQQAAAVSGGLEETPEQREAIVALVEQLEKRNPTKRPTASPLATSRWRLVYTTSESILGKSRPSVFRPVGPIYQFINLAEGTARNEETIRPVPFLPPISEAIDATIKPESDKRVRVFFERLEIGPIKVNFKSENYLDITYLDQDLRISRGGRGNTFVLVRDDPQ